MKNRPFYGVVFYNYSGELRALGLGEMDFVHATEVGVIEREGRAQPKECKILASIELGIRRKIGISGLTRIRRGLLRELDRA